jgi:hypothetical protein
MMKKVVWHRRQEENSKIKGIASGRTTSEYKDPMYTCTSNTTVVEIIAI